MISFKKKIQQISNITLISIVLLISINFLLGWVWEIRTNIKFKNFEPYDEIYVGPHISKAIKTCKAFRHRMQQNNLSL